MFIAHLPAGYLAGKAIFRRGDRSRANLWGIRAAMLGSIFPDFDLAYFYLVDGRGTNHHHYWFHTPSFWLILLGVGALLAWRRKPVLVPGILGFGVGILTHMALDSVASSIFWLRPFSDVPVNLVGVSPRYAWWPWNFIWHPSFLGEVALITTAAGVWYAGRLKKKNAPKVSRDIR